jgi:AbrB family looped-hinge helix DNA binding protein
MSEDSAITHVSTKFQVVIPKRVRKKMKLSPKDKLMVYYKDPSTIILKKPIKSILEFEGTLDYPEGYLEKERSTWD